VNIVRYTSKQVHRYNVYIFLVSLSSLSTLFTKPL